MATPYGVPVRIVEPELPLLPGPGKVTADTLARVEKLQARLMECAREAGTLAEVERHGWVPGSPPTNRTHRMEPLESLAERLEQAVVLLEELYS